jgi:hypothetical protein
MGRSNNPATISWSETGANASIYLFYRKYNGDLRAMSSYLEKFDISAVKIVNVHPDNQAKYNLRTVMAVIDPKKGAPIAPRLTPIFLVCLSRTSTAVVVSELPTSSTAHQSYSLG